MEIFYFIAGLFLGLGLALFIFSRREKETEKMKRELELLARDSFSRLSLEALERNNRAFIPLAEETLRNQARLGAKELEGKKALIDLGIENMGKDITRLKELVVSLEKEREGRYGELAQQLKQTAEETAALRETAAGLKKVLSDSQARGRWGERMAEDILRLAGLLEGINYVKQKKGGAGTRPDFTFFLPKGLKINMDVKFPLDNYVAYLEAETETEKGKYRNKFIKDARARVKETATRDYVNPAEKTLDYAIMFIPNEQVFAFINSEDREFMDFTLKNRVVACSPLTLYGVLAVIRQSVDNFILEEKTAKILTLMGTFYKQWDEFMNGLEKMGRRLDDAVKEYGKMINTRCYQLEKPLREIENLRREKELEVSAKRFFEEDGD